MDCTQRDCLSFAVTEADHVKVWQTVGKLRRRHGLVMSGKSQEPGYRVVDWTWEARRVWLLSEPGPSEGRIASRGPIRSNLGSVLGYLSSAGESL
jgi:hypothetical protein